jgi:hypothetical protein
MTEPDRHKDKLVGLRGVSADKWRRFGLLVGMKGRSPYLASVIDWVIGESDTPPVRPSDAARGKTARKASPAAQPMRTGRLRPIDRPVIPPKP